MKTNEHREDVIYALGYSEEERQRLIEQDAFLGGFTKRLFLSERHDRPIGKEINE